jgi:hypothetical protein
MRGTLVAEAAEYAALVSGREPSETVTRLECMRDALAAGGIPTVAELALLGHMRERYGHELGELIAGEGSR